MALSRPRLWFRRSLPAKLAVAAAIFVSTVASVHVLSLDRLTRLGTASSEVRENRWLESTQFIQRLREPVSDLRALEADSLLINDPGQRRQLAHDSDLISQAAEAKDRYGALRQDVDEERVFEGFSNSWAEHVGHAQQLASLLRTGARGEALSLFDGAARTSFSNATDQTPRTCGPHRLESQERPGYRQPGDHGRPAFDLQSDLLHIRPVSQSCSISLVLGVASVV